MLSLCVEFNDLSNGRLNDVFSRIYYTKGAFDGLAQMMEPVLRVTGDGANAVEGTVRFDWPKLLWNLGMILGVIVFAPFYFGFDTFLLFLIGTYLTLLLGHSAGMHRMMIHRAYEAHPVVERALIYLGVLVGMGGPFGMIKIHDLRDWAQRQEDCHPFFSHKESYLQDLWWQLTCKFDFKKPPVLKIEAKYADDLFYRWLEATWRFHQLALAALLYVLGGWSYVVWGVFARISISVIGHWTITYFCHNPGPGTWHVKGAAVQASNMRGLGWVTYGECWHNNHHAFPESARIGLQPGQPDPTWYFIRSLEFLRLAEGVREPRREAMQEDLVRISQIEPDQ